VSGGTGSERPRLFAPRRPEDFDALSAGRPPWDIGRPQPAFLALAEAGAVVGRVLDVGCGTGEHALMAAGLGLEATGVDLATAAIAAATRVGGRCYLLCFSDRQPGVFGPRRVTQEELRASFADGWRVEAIEATTIDTLGERGVVQAWLATITRVEAPGRMA
jgi:SAM-dependent methyltransferase